MHDELSGQDRAILDLESKRWRYAGAKEQAIREGLGLNSTHYARRLNELLDSPAAALYAPMLVNRLRAIRDQRMAQRTRRRAS